PATQARHVLQPTAGFRPPRKSHEFYLNGRASIGFCRTRWMLEGTRGHIGISVLIDREVVDREVRDVAGFPILRKGALRRPPLCRVMDNLERATACVSSRRPVERHPHRKTTLCHDPSSFPLTASSKALIPSPRQCYTPHLRA